MQRSVAELESIVRERICRVCTDRTASGECGLEEPSSCALFRLFPEVAKAIESVHSDDICDYLDAIRRNVCSVCAGQDHAGNCEARQEVRCALDAYLVAVVDAVEEATGKQFDRKDLGFNAGAAGKARLEIRL
jgi:hypothetical protein